MLGKKEPPIITVQSLYFIQKVMGNNEGFWPGNKVITSQIIREKKKKERNFGTDTNRLVKNKTSSRYIG